MYSGLGTVLKYHRVPKADAGISTRSFRGPRRDASPAVPASAGRQPEAEIPRLQPLQASNPIKRRLFANPHLPLAAAAGGLEQLAGFGGGFGTYDGGGELLDVEQFRLRRLKVGSRVIAGTVLARVGKAQRNKASGLDFEIRPAGKGAPRIDPKPILDGWKLLEATAIYRASGRNVLYGEDEKAGGFSIGQILLLPKPLLERRVLSDERIDIYACGRDDVKSGRVDRRVLATLEYLAESGLRPTVTSLRCGHGFFTSSGNVSHHSSGNAVDIAKVNGVPVLGHQEPGGVTDTAVRRLMRLQGTVRPDQIISLLEIGGPTLAMSDHADHIHIGFRPLFGRNEKLGRQALAVLRPGQWSNLLARLRLIENPVVPTKPSKYAVAVKGKRASRAHRGE